MHSRFFLPLLVSLLLFLPKLNAGALTWEKQKIEMTTEGPQEEIKVDFPFKNTSSHPVTIVSVEPGCVECTSASADKKTYAPGETGRINMIFRSGERTGLQEKTVTVTTDDPKETPTELLLSVNIKEYLTIAPRLLTWKTGDKLDEKIITLSALPSQPITQIEAAFEPAGGFEVKVEVVKAGQEYRLHVKPTSTAQRTNAGLRLHVKFTTAPDQDDFAVFVYVTAPGDGVFSFDSNPPLSPHLHLPSVSPRWIKAVPLL